MLDIGLGELIVIGVIAILFLGPDKLPKAIVDLAKMIKAVKKTINDAKDNLDKEIRLDEIKTYAHEYKKMITSAGDEIKSIKEMTSIEERPKEGRQDIEPVEPIIQIPTDSKTESKGA